MMDLWASYMNERFGYHYILRDHGFICWTVEQTEQSKILSISEIYIHPDHRKSNLALSMYNELMDLAKTSGVDKVWTQVWQNDAGKDRAMRMNLAMGFKLLSSDADRIVLFKNIKEA